MLHTENENDCVGCPQGCIHCGRKSDYPVLDYLECDNCGEGAEVLYDYDGDQLCLKCLIDGIGAKEINEDNYIDFMPEREEI